MYPHVCLASSLNVAYKLMLKHAESQIYMGSHTTGITPWRIVLPPPHRVPTELKAVLMYLEGLEGVLQ